MSEDGLPRRLQQAREQAGISKANLAEKIGVKSASVWRWEKGKTTPKAHRLSKIAEITGASVDWLNTGNESDNHKNATSKVSPIHPNTVGSKIIAYQGRPGAYSHLACKERYPQFEPKPYASFKDCFEVVENEEAGLAMIPIENSLGGRVADIHLILPDSNLYIVDEHFQPVQHMLWGQPDAELADITKILSHEQALSQCKFEIEGLGAEPVKFPDTAGACEYIASKNDKSLAALASSLAGEVYGLKNLRYRMEDKFVNTTRFIVMSSEEKKPDVSDSCITSFTFTVRSIPAALYKCMGGFATNSVNFIKLESYMPMTDHQTASFYAEIEGHRDTENVRQAFEELHYYTSKVKVIGVFSANRKR